MNSKDIPSSQTKDENPFDTLKCPTTSELISYSNKIIQNVHPSSSSSQHTTNLPPSIPVMADSFNFQDGLDDNKINQMDDLPYQCNNSDQNCYFENGVVDSSLTILLFALGIQLSVNECSSSFTNLYFTGFFNLENEEVIKRFEELKSYRREYMKKEDKKFREETRISEKTNRGLKSLAEISDRDEKRKMRGKINTMESYIGTEALRERVKRYEKHCTKCEQIIIFQQDQIKQLEKQAEDAKKFTGSCTECEELREKLESSREEWAWLRSVHEHIERDDCINQ